MAKATKSENHGKRAVARKEAKGKRMMAMEKP